MISSTQYNAYTSYRAYMYLTRNRMMPPHSLLTMAVIKLPLLLLVIVMRMRTTTPRHWC